MSQFTSVTVAAGDTAVLDIKWKFQGNLHFQFNQLIVNPSSTYSGTLKLQVSPDGGTTWVDVEGVDDMDPGKIYPFQVPADKYRVSLGAGTGSAEVFYPRGF